MAAPASSLYSPGSARLTQLHGAGTDSGSSARQLLAERVLTHGVVEGLHIQDWGYYVATIPAGAPGLVDVNLLTSLVSPDGDGVQPVAGKLVYLEVVQLTGTSDVAIRRSAANAILLLSGITDTLLMPDGHKLLLDVQPDSSVLTTAGLAFDATHKMLQFESTVGATVAIIAAVV